MVSGACSECTGVRIKFNDDLVTINVGPEQKPFTMHKDVLCRHSKFFAARFSGRWSDEKRVPLPEADIDTFQAYAEYLYSSHILLCITSPKPQSLGLGVVSLVRLYMLGEYIEDRALRNRVMYEFFELLDKPDFQWGPETINLIFDDTREGCNLQEYALADHLFDTSPEWLEDNEDSLSPRFTKKLLRGWAAKSQHPKIVYHHPNDSKRNYWEFDAMISGKRKRVEDSSATSRRQQRRSHQE